MKKYKPLQVDDANPCMKCGSVQCAFCSKDVLSAIKGLKKDLGMLQSDDMMCKNEIYELIDEWFPSLKL